MEANSLASCCRINAVSYSGGSSIVEPELLKQSVEVTVTHRSDKTINSLCGRRIMVLP